MSQIVPGPGIAQRIVAMDEAGVDRAEIVARLAATGLPPEAASQLVVEILDAEEMGRLARRKAERPARNRFERAGRTALRGVVAALGVFVASAAVAWLASLLPGVADFVGLYGLGLAFGRLIAVLAGVVFALLGLAVAAEARDGPLLVGVSAGAVLYYVLILTYASF